MPIGVNLCCSPKEIKRGASFCLDQYFQKGQIMDKEFKIGDLVIFEMNKSDSQIPSGTVGVVEAVYKDACKINFIELDLNRIVSNDWLEKKSLAGFEKVQQNIEDKIVRARLITSLCAFRQLSFIQVSEAVKDLENVHIKLLVEIENLGNSDAFITALNRLNSIPCLKENKD